MNKQTAPYTRHIHQDEGFTAIKNAITSLVHKMQILYPTGGGKTNTEMDAIRFMFEQKEAKGEFGVAVVLAPRIQLCLQHMREHTFNPIYGNVKFHPMAVHSGRKDIPPEFMVDAAIQREIADTLSKTEYAQVKCVTDSESIRNEYARTKEMGKHFVLFATYHSAQRLASAGIPIDMIIADEAQYLVTTEFSTLHTVLEAAHWLFFTATQKVTASLAGLGMNNPKLFGEVIYKVEPKVLIERGIIVPPCLHIMYAKGVRSDGVLIRQKKVSTEHDRESNYDAVKEIVQKQGALTPFDEKILVACKDADEVAYLANQFINDKEFEDYKVFYTSSKAGNWAGKTTLTRGEFLQAVNARKGKALIFHYDILSEGIDVDGISGVIFLRSMGIAKTLQTIGRSLRVLKTDRALPIADRIKKCAWISVPVVCADGMNSEDYQSVKKTLYDIVKAMIVGGLEPEMVNIHKPRGAVDDDPDFDKLTDEDGVTTTFSELFDLDAIKHNIMETLKNEETGELSVIMRQCTTEDEFFDLVDKVLA